MDEFRGILNEKGLASFNQGLFDNMACFSDVVWVIDLQHEMVEVLLDNIDPETVDHSYSLEEVRNRIRNRYPGENKKIVDRYTVEYLRNLKETVYFNNPTFVSRGRRFKLRQAITPDVYAGGKVNRVYVTAINTQNFMSSDKERTEIYKTASMILSHGKNLDVSIHDTLQFIGESLNVSRVYIVENDPEDPEFCNCTFEWCDEAATPQIQNLQNISYAEYGYNQIFDQAQLFCCSDVSEIQDKPTREMMEAQQIKAFINYAFYDNDEFAGFIGVEDCRTPRQDWDPDSEEVEVLTFVSDLLTTYLIKERNLTRAQENQAILDHFVSAYAAAYDCDLKEDSFIVLNMDPEFETVFTMNGSRSDMEHFVAEHVHPDDQEFMFTMIDNNYVRERLKTEDEIKFSFRQFVHGKEQMMHAVIMKGTSERHAAVGFMDVTAEVQKEKELNEQLQAANNAKRDFLSSMSHDIRTPMNAIMGMVDIAMGNMDDKEKMADSLGKIRIAGEQLIALVNDILDISAIESGKARLNPEPYNVVEGVNRLGSLIVGMLNGKQIDVKVNQHDILHPWIFADPTRRSQVAMNLLNNAIKYTPEGGTVTFENWQEAGEDGATWEYFVVSDTGIGMSEEFMENMWDTFSRATDTRVNKIQGAGLGLSIIKAYVELMGGTVTAESQLDKGSTFTVKVPVVPAEVKEHAIERPQEDSAPVDLNILIAEDNDLNWEIVEDLLGMNGVTCTRAENGKVAVEKLSAAEPGTYDAILMDMQMPVMSGIDATRAIRALDRPDARSIPIIALTANAFTEDAEQCKEAGMNEHLSKPVDIDKVLAMLKHYAGKKQ